MNEKHAVSTEIESMTLSVMQDRAYRAAVTAGWVDESNPVLLPEMIALIHSEASEALESYRNNEPKSWTRADGKPEGVGAEFADILIRIGHYAEALGIDLNYEVQRKMRFNVTRGYRHSNDSRYNGQPAKA